MAVKRALHKKSAKLKAERQSKKGMNSIRRSIRHTYERYGKVRWSF